MNTKAFLVKKEEEVREDELFFYRYVYKINVMWVLKNLIKTSLNSTLYMQAHFLAYNNLCPDDLQQQIHHVFRAL